MFLRLFYVLTTLLRAIFVCAEKQIQSWDINLASYAALRYGDIVVSPSKFRKYNFLKNQGISTFVEDEDLQWENNIVPYRISFQYTKEQVEIILEALSELQRRSCFKFIKRSAEEDYLDIRPLDGCYSYVGKIGGRQTVSLGRGCIANHVILHEIMHAIGLEHEHQRPDRDDYVTILYENVMPEQIFNFEKIDPNQINLFGLDYDYKSIMHYDKRAFGKFDPETRRRMVTMIPQKPEVELTDNYVLSKLDIEKLNRIGKCQHSPSSEKADERCADSKSDCQKSSTKELCSNAIYREFLKKACPLTCGWCDEKPVQQKRFNI